MFKVTPTIYGSLMEQVLDAVERAECPGFDYADPPSVSGRAETEEDGVFCTLDFRAFPRYRRIEINPGLYGPDGEWGYQLTGISVSCRTFTAEDENGCALPNDFKGGLLSELAHI